MGDLATPSFTLSRDQKIIRALRENGKRLFRFIRSRVRSNEDAEDILQEVWLQLSRVLDIEPIEEISAWLYQVARNRIIDKQRKKKPLALSDLLLDTDVDEADLAATLFADTGNPDDELSRRLFRDQLLHALAALPPKQRQVFILNEIEGRTFQEIADQTGENIKTLISRKRYATRKLRERLADFCDEPFAD
jgi:RNA polymerase sigma factor (sigma-70 family)